jgi:hypothetical protein
MVERKQKLKQTLNGTRVAMFQLTRQESLSSMFQVLFCGAWRVQEP